MYYLLSSLLVIFLLSPAAAQTTISSQKLQTEHYKIILRNLNPEVGSWYLLTIEEKASKNKMHSFHIEVPSNNRVPLSLDKNGIMLGKFPCPLWDDKHFNLLKVDFKAHTDPYYPICENYAFIRLAKPSNTKISSTEALSRILRNNLASGERLINFFKPYIVSLAAEQGDNLYSSGNAKERSNSGPAAALTSYPADRVPYATQHQIGIALQGGVKHLAYGQWYEVQMHPGIYLSLMMPGWIDEKIKKSFPDRVHPLNSAEANKLVYLIAYDLDYYQVEYVAGLKQPGIREPSNLQKYLVPVGNVPSYRRQDTVGVFIGGFQQRHGRFKRGPHKGKVYGYTQNGVTLESLSSDLATFISTGNDLDIISWPPKNINANAIVSARQNGVPLIENGEAHPLVNNWGWGNWSGDSEGRLQSLRSAICIQEQQSKRYLIFSAFTSATPSSMAKTLQAYQCKTAMHLDMNAFMYIHNALIDYRHHDDVKVEYLHHEMEYPKGLKQHRYILDNNERDFFYVFRKNSQ